MKVTRAVHGFPGLPMRWSRLRAVVTSVVMLCFGMGTAARGAAHTCASNPAYANHAQDGGDPHRTPHHQPAPGDCHCVGHACCFTPVVGPAAPESVRAVLSINAPQTVFSPAVAPTIAPRHLLPFAHPPPASLL